MPPKVTDGKKTKQETCLVCEDVTQDSDDISDKGEDAVFCEGTVFVRRGYTVDIWDSVRNYMITLVSLMIKPWPIMLNFLPIMLLSNAQKIAYYAQYYAHDYCNYATVCI